MRRMVEVRADAIRIVEFKDGSVGKIQCGSSPRAIGRCGRVARRAPADGGNFLKRGRKGVNQRAAVGCRKTGTQAEELQRARSPARTLRESTARLERTPRRAASLLGRSRRRERSVPLDAEAASVVAFHSALARGSVRAASAAAAVRPCPAPGRAGDRDPMVAGWPAVSACSSSPSDPCEASHCAASWHRRTSAADRDVRRQAANPARASPGWTFGLSARRSLRQPRRSCEGDRESRGSARRAPSPAIPRASRARTISSARPDASL